jgi:hypothetical protein
MMILLCLNVSSILHFLNVRKFTRFDFNMKLLRNEVNEDFVCRNVSSILHFLNVRKITRFDFNMKLLRNEVNDGSAMP